MKQPPLFFPPYTANLPVLHCDETLYSWLGRTHQLNGRPNALLFSQRLFDYRYAATAHDLPVRLGQLYENTERLLPTPNTLAVTHSLLGYYQPWLTEHRHDLAMQSVLYGSVRDLKMKLGFPASRLSTHPLKACPTCIAQETEDLGYARWHTQHQFPSVWICPKHQVPLWVHHSDRQIRHLREWLLPHRIVDKTTYAINDTGLSTLMRLTELSQLSAMTRACTLHPYRLSSAYRVALKNRGLIAGSNSIRMKTLIKWVQEMYRPLAKIPGFALLNTLTSDWAGFVGAVARNTSHPVHPMKHLLMINLLFEDWDAFTTAYHRVNETQESLAATQEPTIALPDPRHEIFVGLVRGESLSLSAAGRHVGISPSTAVRWAKLHSLNYTRRTKYVTESVLERCRQKLRSGQAKQDVAKAASVSMTTITRLLSAEPTLRIEWQAAMSRNRRAQYRLEFKTLLASNQGVPLKLIRRLPNNRYAWLYRHDRAWLTSALSTDKRNLGPQRSPKKVVHQSGASEQAN